MVATDDAEVDVGVDVTGVLGCAIVVDGADETTLNALVTAGNSWSQPAVAEAAEAAAAEEGASEKDDGAEAAAAAAVERPGSDRDDLDLRAK